MGNLCSKSANQDDQFSTPGRVLGSSSQTQPTSAPVPQKITSSTPGRTVGGPGANSGGDDPRGAAARAAEVCKAINPPSPCLLVDLASSSTTCDMPHYSLYFHTGTSCKSVTINREAIKSATSTEAANSEPGVEFSLPARTAVTSS